MTSNMTILNNQTFPTGGNIKPSFDGCKLPNGLTSVFDGVLLITILVFALVGNTLVFIALSRFRVLQNITNTFIASLSAADLLVSLLPIPMTFAAFVCSWLPEEQAKKPEDIAYLICDIMTSSVSITSLAAIAVDRCIAISSPYQYRRILTKTKVIIVVIALWIFCFLAALLKLFINPRSYTLFIIIVTYIIPVPVMLICYGKIYIIARFQAKKIQSLKRAVTRLKSDPSTTPERRTSTSSTKTKKTSFSEICPDNIPYCNGKLVPHETPFEMRSIDEKAEDRLPLNADGDHENNLCHAKMQQHAMDIKLRRKSTMRALRQRFSLSRYSVSDLNRDLKAAKSLAVIMGTFLLTWTPFMGINFIFFFCRECKLNYNVAKYFKFLHYTNSAINPLLYALLNKKWRAAFRMMLCRSKDTRRADYSHSELLSGW